MLLDVGARRATCCHGHSLHHNGVVVPFAQPDAEVYRPLLDVLKGADWSDATNFFADPEKLADAVGILLALEVVQAETGGASDASARLAALLGVLDQAIRRLPHPKEQTALRILFHLDGDTRGQPIGRRRKAIGERLGTGWRNFRQDRESELGSRLAGQLAFLETRALVLAERLSTAALKHEPEEPAKESPRTSGEAVFVKSEDPSETAQQASETPAHRPQFLVGLAVLIAMVVLATPFLAGDPRKVRPTKPGKPPPAVIGPKGSVLVDGLRYTLDAAMTTHSLPSPEGGLRSSSRLYALVRLHVTNQGTDPADVSSSDYLLELGTKRYGADSDAGDTLPGIKFKTLQPGDTTVLTMAFDVPSDVLKELNTAAVLLSSTCSPQVCRPALRLGLTQLPIPPVGRVRARTSEGRYFTLMVSSDGRIRIVGTAPISSRPAAGGCVLEFPHPRTTLSPTSSFAFRSLRGIALTGGFTSSLEVKGQIKGRTHSGSLLCNPSGVVSWQARRKPFSG